MRELEFICPKRMYKGTRVVDEGDADANGSWTNLPCDALCTAHTRSGERSFMET